MTTVSELYRASANENGQMGQMGSQLGTCSTRGTGKETASGESCRGTQPARSSSAHPLLLLHLHLSSSVFSQPAGAAQTWESSLDLLGCCVSQSFSPADTILGVFALEGTQRQFSSNFTCGWPTFHLCPPSPEWIPGAISGNAALFGCLCAPARCDTRLILFPWVSADFAMGQYYFLPVSRCGSPLHTPQGPRVGSAPSVVSP